MLPSLRHQDTVTPTVTLAALCLTEVVALGALAIPLVVGLALQVRDLDTSLSDEGALAIVTAAGAVVAMVSNPVFGWLGDRIRTVSRAVWVLGGLVGGCLLAPLVWTVDTVLGLTVVWCLLQMTYNATFAGLYGTIADVVPEHDRSRVSGWFAASSTTALLVSLGMVAMLPKTPAVLFVLMPVIALGVGVPAYLHLRTLGRPVATDVLTIAAGWRLPAAPAQYWWVWLQRLLAQLAHSVVGLFGVFYLVRRVGMGDGDAATWVSAATSLAAGASVVAALVAGRLAGAARSYGPFLGCGIGLIAAALALKMVTASAGAYVVATLLVGVGIGVYYAVDLALVLRTVPTRAPGTFLGFFNIARTLPQSLAPAIAPALLALGDDVIGADRSQNYFALYAAGLVVAVVAMALIRPITVRRREPAKVPV